MKIQTLGNKYGKLLVFGGVYSNLQALQALKQMAEAMRIPAENVICTGDVVAYCAQPEECVQLVRQWGVSCISGNVEQQLAAGEANCACDFIEGGRCDSFSKEWYPYTQENLSEVSLEWMRQLPEFLTFQYAGKKVFVLHGAYDYTSEFIFESTDWALKQKNFEQTGAEVILAGHCGLPFSQQKNGQYWLNSGVLGMPANDGTTRVWYMLLDDANGVLHYEHRALDYDFETASRLMAKKQLTPAYAKTLLTGIWDNMEILPAAEAAMQGEGIKVSS